MALVSSPPANHLLSTYFVSHGPRITEHGPQWATARLPFLGRQFAGTQQCEEYFTLLSETLTMDLDEGSFPAKTEFVVDATAGSTAVGGDEDKLLAGAGGVVSVVGRGKFASLRTGKAWQEQFIYRLSGFDEEGRIGHWEIWADPLSAWVAVGDE